MSVSAIPARRLEPADHSWAVALLRQAMAQHPALRYVCGDRPAPHQYGWLLDQLFAYTLCHGVAYGNATNTAVVLWLGPEHAPIAWAWRLRLRLLAPRRLGWAASRRLHRLLSTQTWLRRHTLAVPHHQLLAVAGYAGPPSRSHDESRRLLAATLALRCATGHPCYLSVQVPAQLVFYQGLGFSLLGHCTVGEGLVKRLNIWALLFENKHFI